MQNGGALKAAGGYKNCCSHQFPSFFWLLFTFHCLTICVSTARPIFLCRLSRFNTHKRTPRASRQPLPHERRVRAVSANKRQSPLFSPATSHHSSPLCDRLARWLSLSLALHPSLQKKKKKSTRSLCSFSGKSGDLQSDALANNRGGTLRRC